ncbi:sensor histidine kinase [Coraliomargarita parva]|uniref:sensor histidine kinase n=1 Tax=Coraliomargarita parva TaxID=3014050 RepID=UPI0022B4236F|nr:ATP-binding protein [Coraliomargarita parva]
MKCFLLFILLISVCHGETLIRSISDLRGLSAEEAAEELPVLIKGNVVLYNTENGDMMIHDGKEGMFIFNPDLPEGVETFHQGDRVLIRGNSFYGGYIPSVAPGCKVLAVTPDAMPEPMKLTGEDVFAPDINLQWVEIHGVVIGSKVEEHFLILIVQVEGWMIPVMLPRHENSNRVRDLMQRAVVIHGVVGTNFNDFSQMTGRLLYVNSLDDIRMSGKGIEDDSAPLVRVDELLRANSRLHELSRVRGVVTAKMQDGFYMRGEGGSVFVYAATDGDMQRGDRVEVTGFAVVAPFRPVLRAAKVEGLGQAEMPQAQSLKIRQLNELTLEQREYYESETEIALSGQQYELVTVDALVLGVSDGVQNLIINCEADNRFFEASISRTVDDAESIEAGARVRLTGICELKPLQSELTMHSISHIRIIMRDADDIVVIESPPWLTARRALWISIVLFAVAVLAALWGILLRRQVSIQTKIIGEKIENEVIQNERQRLARELHDTVEQQLTGLAIVLENVRNKIKCSPEKALSSLEVCMRMLRYCREEARSSIRDLRSVALKNGGLEGAFKELLPLTASNADAAFTYELEGDVSSIREPNENHLHRIAGEAVANAVHHGKAKHIHAKLVCGEDEITLEVTDDGSGFDTSKPPPRGHFGLQGMRERADKMQGTISIESSPQGGTKIRVRVPRAVVTSITP